MKTLLLWVFGLVFVAAGVGHFRVPDTYAKIMPPYLPWPVTLVYLSGVAEILLGALLLVPRTRRVAAWGIIALLVAVFPANVHMALNADQFPQIPAAALWVRLPLQGLLMLWAWAYTRNRPRSVSGNQGPSDLTPRPPLHDGEGVTAVP